MLKNITNYKEEEKEDIVKLIQEIIHKKKSLNTKYLKPMKITQRKEKKNRKHKT